MMQAEETPTVRADDLEVEMSMERVQELMDSMGVKKSRPIGFGHFTKHRASTVKRKKKQRMQRLSRKSARG